MYSFEKAVAKMEEKAKNMKSEAKERLKNKQYEKKGK
jgi:hypothetical protein